MTLPTIDACRLLQFATHCSTMFKSFPFTAATNQEVFMRQYVSHLKPNP